MGAQIGLNAATANVAYPLDSAICSTGIGWALGRGLIGLDPPASIPRRRPCFGCGGWTPQSLLLARHRPGAPWSPPRCGVRAAADLISRGATARILIEQLGKPLRDRDDHRIASTTAPTPAGVPV
ncbi:hypothetical protein ACRAWD_23105 [Caulobacter segnis]